MTNEVRIEDKYRWDTPRKFTVSEKKVWSVDFHELEAALQKLVNNCCEYFGNICSRVLFKLLFGYITSE